MSTRSVTTRSSIRTWVLDVPFEMRAVASAAGARWDSELRAHVWQGDELPPGLVPFASAPYSWERWREDELAGGPPPELDSSGSAPVPRPHQEEAIEAILAARAVGRSGFLLADDVGLGKTITTWEAIRRMPDVRTVLVVCPLAVVPHWRRTIAAMGTGGRRVMVTNYDRLKTLMSVPASATKAKKAATKNKRVANEGKPLVDFDVVVADESHKCKAMDSQRSRMVRRLSEGAFVIWASGTAGTTPVDLSYADGLLMGQRGRGVRVKDKEEWAAWCRSVGLDVRAGRYGELEWHGGAAQLDQMREMLFGGPIPLGIRRSPTDIAGWPEIQRIPHEVDLDAASQALYVEAWDEFRRALELSRRGKNPKNGLAAQLRFRQKASLLRVGQIADLIADLRDNGRQVAVSVTFLETLEALIERLAVRKVASIGIHGGMGPREREEARVAFQQGRYPVALFTVREGVSFHAGEEAVGGNDVPRALVIADPLWSALDAKQVEGRAHRDGKFAPAYYAYASGTIEERVLAVVLERLAAMGHLLGDEEMLAEVERLIAEHQSAPAP